MPGAISYGSYFIQLALNDCRHDYPYEEIKKEPEDCVIVLLDLNCKSLVVFPHPVEVCDRDNEQPGCWDLGTKAVDLPFSLDIPV